MGPCIVCRGTDDVSLRLRRGPRKLKRARIESHASFESGESQGRSSLENQPLATEGNSARSCIGLAGKISM